MGDVPLHPVVVETILVVEDDAAVRSVVTEMLTEHGYAVLAAESADEAVELANGTGIDLVVLDLVLPKTEVDLTEALSGAGFVFMSGFPAEQLPRTLPFGSAFIQKPFSSDALLTTVRLALAAGP